VQAGAGFVRNLILFQRVRVTVNRKKKSIANAMSERTALFKMKAFEDELAAMIPMVRDRLRGVDYRNR
jgi:hypothetical protein